MAKGSIKRGRRSDVFDIDDVEEIDAFDLDGRLFIVRLPGGGTGEAFITGTEEIRVEIDGPVDERWVAAWLNNQVAGRGRENVLEWLRRERVTLRSYETLSEG